MLYARKKRAFHGRRLWHYKHVMSDSLHQEYRDAVQERLDALSRRSTLFGMLRLVLLIILFIAGAQLAAGTSDAAAAMILSLVCFMLFLYFTARHLAIDQLRAFHRNLETYYQRGEDRISGKWQHEQADGSDYIQDWHPYAHDLDLIGPHGLYAFINTAGSEAGREALAQFLFHDDAQADADRRDSVRALAGQHERRATWWAALQQEMQLWSADEEQQAHRAYQEWLAGDWHERMPQWLLHPLRLFLLALVVGGFFILGITWLWTGCIIIAVLASFINDRALNCWSDLPVDRINRLLRSWKRALDLLLHAEADNKCLSSRVREQLTAMQEQLQQQLGAWHGLSLRMNPFWRYGLGAVLLADWHYRHRLIVWNQQHAMSFLDAIAVLGQVDAIHALASYAAEQGGSWAETPSDTATLIEVEELGHPLIPREQRVGNDISLQQGQVLLLTGANASGKSTFLRSLALAVLMARVGLPVCARRCALRPQRLATVMRIQDALWQGRSRFQAEVHQLKQVLDRSRSAGDPVMLVLDEILAGTNSEERHLGSKALIEHLTDYQGLILITTHDLSLAHIAEAAPERIRCCHFADRAALNEERSDVLFDYKLRPGVLQTTNALQVMRAAGLPV